MLKSMTGFGTVIIENDTASISVEVKSVNSKSQDFSFRLPRIFQDKEAEVKTFLGQTLERGKVSISIDFSKKGTFKPKLTVNSEIFNAYYQDLKKNADAVGADTHELMRIVTSLPEVYDVDKADGEIEHEWEIVFGAIKEAVKKCDEFRLTEGATLQKQIESYINKIVDLSAKINAQDPIRIEKMKERIRERVQEHLKTKEIDETRFEQELIYWIEKLDITEEKVRLKTHLDYFIETIHSPEANGKKLGFIAQEIGREINTTGSKANDAQIQRWVVEMKDELEKIKEQTLNIL
ncbi:MAG: YicC/YloC family endoribonuclease [Cytophagales bacterium]